MVLTRFLFLKLYQNMRCVALYFSQRIYEGARHPACVSLEVQSTAEPKKHHITSDSESGEHKTGIRLVWNEPDSMNTSWDDPKKTKATSYQCSPEKSAVLFYTLFTGYLSTWCKTQIIQ